MKIGKGSLKHLILSLVTTVIMGFILFPLFDFIICLFTQETFKYSVKDHIINPLVFCSIVAIVIWFIERRKK